MQSYQPQTRLIGDILPKDQLNQKAMNKLKTFFEIVKTSTK